MKRLAFVVFCACGASASQSGAQKSSPPPQQSTVSPEKYADVATFFDKKRPIVVVCYNNAVTNRKLAEGSQGRVTLGMTVTPTGAPQGVHVVDSTLKSKDAEDCLVQMVSKWEVPPPGGDMEFTFSYEFRPN